MGNSKENSKDSVAEATKACELHVKHHARMGQIILIGALVLLGLVVFFALTYARIQSSIQDQRRIDHLFKIEKAEQGIKGMASRLRDAEESYSRALKDVNDKEIEIKEYKEIISEFPEKISAKEVTIKRKKVEKKDIKEDLLIIEQLQKTVSRNKELLTEAQKSIAYPKRQLESRLQTVESRSKELLKEREILETMLQEHTETERIVLTDKFLLGLVGVLVIIFSVFTSLYKFHQKEMSRNERYRLGFERIQILLHLEGNALQKDVSKVLTDGAFQFEPEGAPAIRTKKIESPLPGHPTSELATLVANKVGEKIGPLLEKFSGRNT